MDIFIVGNIVKDVYLSIDSRTETLETDRHNTKWLNLSFDASVHRFFHRISSLGGAAVTSEVLAKMGLPATITNPTNEYRTYRYILTSDDNVCYLTPTKYTSATFTPPDSAPKYLYVDRSANLDAKNSEKILQYLEQNPNVALVLYLKNFNNRNLNNLTKKANIIFIESSTPVSDNYQALLKNTEKIIYTSEHTFTYQDFTETVRRERIDKLTHLSAYSIASATILGSIILGESPESALRLARVNLENSTLDSCLTLHELQSIASVPPENLELISATLTSNTKGPLSAASITTKLPAIPSVELNKKLLQAYADGFRIAEFNFYTKNKDAKQPQPLANCAKRSQSAGLVPTIVFDNVPNGENIKALLRELLSYGVNLNATVFKIDGNYSLAASASAGALPLSDGTSAALTGPASAAAFSSASRAAASAAGS